MSSLVSQTSVSHLRLLTMPFSSSAKHFRQLLGISPLSIFNRVARMCSLFHTSSMVWFRMFMAMPSFLTRPAVLSSTSAPLAFAVQHTLTSPLGRVARCIHGRAQNVLLRVMSMPSFHTVRLVYQRCRTAWNIPLVHPCSSMN